MRIGRHPHPPGKGMPFRLMATLLTAGLLLISPATLAISASAAPSAPTTTHARAASGHPSRPFDGFAHVLHVPKDYATIQAAVDAARTGDLVLIAAGDYHEHIVVAKPELSGITIRGEDRNGVIIDGKSFDETGKLVYDSRNGIYIEGIDNVIVENLTVRYFQGNGVWWQGPYDSTTHSYGGVLHGYRGSYITAYDNGDYGIYSRAADHGEFNNDYSSGQPDSGFYIGQCFPCDALITNVDSEVNGLGYSGTNAGGNLVIKDSIWRNNMAGIVPNTQEGEKLFPQRGATIINNTVDNNNNANAPGGPYQRTAVGVGILLPGTNENYVAGNTVTNHSQFGILVSMILGPAEDDANQTDFWVPWGNVVEHNKVHGSGVADIALGWPTARGNCFSDNEAATTLPAFLEISHACGSPLKDLGGGDIVSTLKLYAVNNYASGPSYKEVDWRTVAPPPAQQGMPDITAPRGDIFTESFPTDLPNNGLPSQVTHYGPAILEPWGTQGETLWQLFLTFLTGVLPYALYVTWVGRLLLGLAKRDDLSEGMRLGLVTLVLAVPVIGPLLCQFVFKAGPMPKSAEPATPAPVSTPA